MKLAVEDLVIIKVLEVSTSHIKEEDNDFLFRAVEASEPVYDLGTGFLVYVKRIDDLWPPRKKLLGKRLSRIFKMTREAGCNYVWLDMNSKEYPELKAYEW